MLKSFCALGCFPTKNLFLFPSRKNDFKRRKLWLDFFQMEEPHIDTVFACEKHFSSTQTTSEGLRRDAVPDIPTNYNATVHHFKRKLNNWRTNVIVVTPKDPEFVIYRHETGIFPQNLFNNVETGQPAIQMPFIKSVACSASSQTNTRFCGFVQISDIKEEYRLNCFYCAEMFPIEKWSMFIKHLKTTHFKIEEAFKMTKYLSQDHDYTSILSQHVESSVISPSKISMMSNSFVNLLPPTIDHQQLNMPTTLLAKPIKFIEIPTTECLFKKPDTALPSLLPEPQQSNDSTFNPSMADQVIKLLNETLLSPNFMQTDEDNILIIKNTGSEYMETSNFLKNLINFEGKPPRFKTEYNVKSEESIVPTSSSKHTRPVYTISNGLQDIPSRRNSISHLLLPPLPKNKKAKLVQKRIAKRTLKRINVFEKVYKTVKKRYPNVIEFAHSYDSKSNTVVDQQKSNLTPLSRCLKRTMSGATEILNKMPKESTEIVFEYTPRDIVVSLLESMKTYPVLWEFHDQPFNTDYTKAIEELCRIINNKWSLNVSSIKMKRSIHRILRFYRFTLPCESIDEFEDYFDKCSLFLPSSADAIPRARCVYCCVCFEKDVDLRKHVIERHNSLKWPYKCQKCFERFRECDEYELHKRLPHYEEVFKCEHCNKIFNRRYLYNKHVASHKKSKEQRIEASNSKAQSMCFECEICKKTFTTVTHLNVHKSRHSERFKCHLCPKEFTLRASLKYHLKRHNKELDYMCEICGKGFILKSYLNEHMTKHTGTKITCNICNLKLRKCNLLRHLRAVHIATEGTIEGTLRAKSNGQTHFFRPRSKFARRRTKGPRRYNCKTCNIPFDRLKQLKDHNKQVHCDVERTSCRLCTVEFIHTQNLKRHYRCKHKLHMYQIFMLMHQNGDLNKVLAMTAEELENITSTEFTNFTQDNDKSDSFFEEERMRSDEIQDEIMKAVENLDKQEIKVDDDHSMHDFFTDLLKH